MDLIGKLGDKLTIPSTCITDRHIPPAQHLNNLKMLRLWYPFHTVYSFSKWLNSIINNTHDSSG